MDAGRVGGIQAIEGMVGLNSTVIPYKEVRASGDKRSHGDKRSPGDKRSLSKLRGSPAMPFPPA